MRVGTGRGYQAFNWSEFVDRGRVASCKTRRIAWSTGLALVILNWVLSKEKVCVGQVSQLEELLTGNCKVS